MTDEELVKNYDKPLDNYERKLMESLENDEWETIEGEEKERLLAKMKEAAKNTLSSRPKRKPVTLRLLENDVEKIKEEARQEGIPYQTLIGSVLHKYVSEKCL